MSSLFNYELDETKIRSTLQQVRPTGFTESDWQEFELVYLKSSCNNSKSSSFKLPEINLNINRNVILPALFILALIGISALLISFIDFKTDHKEAEHKLEPNPDNFKATVAPQQKQDNTPAKVEIVQPAVITLQKDTEIKPETTNTGLVNNAGAVTPTISNNATNPAMAPAQVTQEKISPVTSIVQTPPRSRRKKPEKIETEQIETIKAPALIKSEPETSEQEPDLEIKMD